MLRPVFRIELLRAKSTLGMLVFGLVYDLFEDGDESLAESAPA